MYPVFPPQVASGEVIRLLGVAVGAAVLLAVPVVLDEDEDEDDDCELPQVPKAPWQPVPQWSGVEPHQPCCEQHDPWGKPRQVRPTAPPQVPSCETPVGVAVGEADVEVEVTVWPEEARYQFSGASPRHSPTVTAL